jgi:hypothetical protein
MTLPPKPKPFEPRPLDDRTQLTLRLPPILHFQLSEAAAETNRSLNAEIVARLERSFTATASDTSMIPAMLLNLEALTAGMMRREGHTEAEIAEEIARMRTDGAAKAMDEVRKARNANAHGTVNDEGEPNS